MFLWHYFDSTLDSSGDVFSKNCPNIATTNPTRPQSIYTVRHTKQSTVFDMLGLFAVIGVPLFVYIVSLALGQ